MPTPLKHPVAFNPATREIVSPLGSAFRNARNYNPEVDKAHLVCVSCFQAAMVHHRQGGPIAGDNLPGNVAHFQTVPKSPHANDCVASVLIRDETYDPDRINHDKGFLIYLGMGDLRRAFNRNNPALVRRNPAGEIVRLDPDLVDRERVSVKTPKEIVKLMKAAPDHRLRDSVIIHHDRKIPWQDFFIRKGRDEKAQVSFRRWINLARTLAGGDDQPALFHVDLSKSRPRLISGRQADHLRFCLDSFTTTHPETGAVMDVVPLLKVKNPLLFDTFRGDRKEFFVLATPRLYPDSGSSRTYFMDIDVTSPTKVMDVNLGELSQVNRQRARERQEKGLAHAPA